MIPYATVEEASMALGRDLTWLETFWFDYSPQSDYYLYCHNILFLFLIFSLVPLPLVFIELTRSTSDWFNRYKIQPKGKNSFSVMFRCYKDVMKMFIFVVGQLQLVSYPSIQDPIASGHIITFWLWIALRQIEAIETHSGYDFPWTLTKFIPFYGELNIMITITTLEDKARATLFRFSLTVITSMELTK